MSDDRDRRTPREKPAGVRAQTADTLAPKNEDTWSDDEVSATHMGEDPALTLHKMARRSEDTNVKTAQTLLATTSTLTRIEDVRKEMREDNIRVDEKIDGVIEVVGELRVAHAEVTVKVDGVVEKLDDIASVLHEDRQLRKQREHVTMTARVDVDTTREKADIEIAKTGRLAKIEIWKGIAIKGVVAVLSAIGMFLAGAHC